MAFWNRKRKQNREVSIEPTGKSWEARIAVKYGRNEVGIIPIGITAQSKNGVKNKLAKNVKLDIKSIRMVETKKESAS